MGIKRGERPKASWDAREGGEGPRVGEARGNFSVGHRASSSGFTGYMCPLGIGAAHSPAPSHPL